jgi:hypothetical protein
MSDTRCVASAGIDALEEIRAAGHGPWSPEALAEDASAMAEFERNGEGIPFDEVVAWIESWGTASELPAPKPRRDHHLAACLLRISTVCDLFSLR